MGFIVRSNILVVRDLCPVRDRPFKLTHTVSDKYHWYCAFINADQLGFSHINIYFSRNWDVLKFLGLKSLIFRLSKLSCTWHTWSPKFQRCGCLKKIPSFHICPGTKFILLYLTFSHCSLYLIQTQKKSEIYRTWQCPL